jgi:hypothetical protein
VSLLRLAGALAAAAPAAAPPPQEAVPAARAQLSVAHKLRRLDGVKGRHAAAAAAQHARDGGQAAPHLVEVHAHVEPRLARKTRQRRFQGVHFNDAAANGDAGDGRLL